MLVRGCYAGRVCCTHREQAVFHHAQYGVDQLAVNAHRWLRFWLLVILVRA